MDIDKIREEEQKINKENNIKNNSKNYFLNVAMTKEYIILPKMIIVDVFIFLNKIKDSVIDDIDKIRIEKFNNSIKLIFVLKVVFEKVNGHINGKDIVETREAYFYHNATTNEEKKNNIKNNINISKLSKNDIVNTYDLLGD
jgi:hypothetical protein